MGDRVCEARSRRTHARGEGGVGKKEEEEGKQSRAEDWKVWRTTIGGKGRKERRVQSVRQVFLGGS